MSDFGMELKIMRTPGPTKAARKIVQVTWGG